MAGAAHRYLHADAPHERELARLRLLEVRHDEVTRRRLARLGSLAGARCLEVGAGAGSVARMLAAAAGPTGEVVATDADPRFLADLGAVEGAPIEVRRHDIVHDDLEVAAFDLVHCRALLLHLSDPHAALARMAAALRPGGWLLVEDVDFATFGAVPGHPGAAEFDRLWSALVAVRFTEDTIDPSFGAHLPAAVDRLGLIDRGNEALDFRRTGGSPEAQMYHLGMATIATQAPHIKTVGFTDEDIERFRATLLDPDFAFMDARNIAAWGRRPVPGFLG